MKENNPYYLLKNATPLQIAANLNKHQQQRSRLLKQLEQLGIDLTEYEQMPLTQLINKTEYIMNNTYSIKYLGLNKNQMGIISRRINPLVDQQLKIHQQTTEIYSVHKYFYPKPLKTGKKFHTVKNINVDNLQSEIKRQFEENRTEEKNKDHKTTNKNKITGSWKAAHRNNEQLMRRTNSTNFHCKLEQNITPKIDPTRSFSRFLNKGILIVRD